MKNRAMITQGKQEARIISVSNRPVTETETMNIIVAIDGSHFSRVAVDRLIERPWPEGTRIRVVHVVEPFHPEYAAWHANYVPLALQAQKELVDAARIMVDETVDQLKARFGEDAVEGEIHEGYIKDRILELAESWPADLIVVGSHGRKGITKFLLGSVSEAIMSHAPCSVEVVRVKDDPDEDD